MGSFKDMNSKELLSMAVNEKIKKEYREKAFDELVERFFEERCSRCESTEHEIYHLNGFDLCEVCFDDLGGDR